MLVEANEVRFLEMIQIDEPDRSVVRVKGVVLHSSLATKAVTVSGRGRNAIVNITVIPTRKGLTGRFEFEVSLSDTVDRILFGPAEVQIWPSVQQDS
jgi:hypothetical protein